MMGHGFQPFILINAMAVPKLGNHDALNFAQTEFTNSEMEKW
jgi:hypothetical protein